jgi:hypothetical protein
VGARCRHGDGHQADRCGHQVPNLGRPTDPHPDFPGFSRSHASLDGTPSAWPRRGSGLQETAMRVAPLVSVASSRC